MHRQTEMATSLTKALCADGTTLAPIELLDAMAVLGYALTDAIGDVNPASDAYIDLLKESHAIPSEA